MQVDLIPQQVEQTVEQTDSADLVVGILAELDSEASAKMFDALRKLPGPLRVAVLQNDQREILGPANSETTQASAYAFPVGSPLAKLSGPAAGGPSMSTQYQSLFAVADKLQARGCCIMASNLEAVTPQWAWQMAQPLFEADADLVLPHYARRKFEGPVKCRHHSSDDACTLREASQQSDGTGISGFRADCFTKFLPQAAGTPAAIAFIRRRTGGLHLWSEPLRLRQVSIYSRIGGFDVAFPHDRSFAISVGIISPRRMGSHLLAYAKKRERTIAPSRV